jgi:L-fuculose-phosphate aldolase
MVNADLCKDFTRFGQKIVAYGLTSSRFGNISTLHKDKILITKTGSMLDELDHTQIVEVNLKGPCSEDTLASSETCVHRAIYQSTSAQSVIHTHSPYAVALSLIEADLIVPIDSEGKHFLGPMPIVEAKFGSEELATKVSGALKSHNVCLAKGHGLFAIGQNMAESYTMACMAEHSSQISYLIKIFKMKQTV